MARRGAPRPDESARSIRAEYELHGATGYYQHSGAGYRNPHEKLVRAALHEAVRAWEIRLDARVLDLACGSGEVTLALRELAEGVEIDGVDPYTGAAYALRTGRRAAALSFEQIAGGALAGRRYGLVVCSYALHLAAASRLPRVVYQLALIGESLLVLTPHKRPSLRAEWGYSLVGELVVERVRVRLYRR